MAQNLNDQSEVELGSGTANYVSAPDLAPVPDGGTTAVLLGAAITGLALVRRKYVQS